MYSEDKSRKAIDRESMVIVLSDEIISTMRWADDAVLVAESEYHLQTILNTISCIWLEYGLEIETKKKLHGGN